MKTFKFLLWGGLALTVLLGGYSSAQAVNAMNQIEYELHPQFAGLNSTGIVLHLDLSYVNDTPGTVQLSDTLIEVYHRDKQLAKVDLRRSEISVRPRSRGRLSDPDQLGDSISVSIPLELVRQLAPGAVSAFLGFGPPMKLEVAVKTKVKIPWLPRFPIAIRRSMSLEPTA